ncbi:MAG: HAD family hydrolase [Eubacterium sp.]
MTKAVLFDFDETLQDRTEAFESYMDAFLQTYRPDLSQTEIEKCKEDMRSTGNGGYVDRVKWYQRLIDMWSWQDAPDAQELAKHYDYTFGDHCVIFPHTVPLLKKLREMGLITGIISNGPSYLQNHKMDMSGLRDYCDIVVISGDVGVHKPDPQLFVYTANKLNLETRDCVYVGDHPVNDIKGALDSGMKAIRMNWGWFKNQDLRPDVPVIDDIIDVLKYI